MYLCILLVDIKDTILEEVVKPVSIFNDDEFEDSSEKNEDEGIQQDEDGIVQEVYDMLVQEITNDMYPIRGRDEGMLIMYIITSAAATLD